MEKKQAKKYLVSVIVLSIVITLLGISCIFSSAISKSIKNLLFKADIRVNDDLLVHFINVGQGDAIAIKFANEKIMLIDAGPKANQNHLVEYIRDNVMASNNDRVIDYLVLTHSDVDHSGGMSAVFAEFDIKHFFRPAIASKNENLNDFNISASNEEYTEVINLSKQENGLTTDIMSTNFEFYVGDAFVQIFAPIRTYLTTNEMSPIIKISYSGKSFLFTGDILEESEQDMINYYGDYLSADVLKVAHHGSSSSTSENFVNKVKPKYAVICVGDNTYGHPTFETISRLNNVGAEVLTTKNETVRIICYNGNLKVLEHDIIHSYEFVGWWVLVLIVEVVLITNLTVVITKWIIVHKKEVE